MPAVIFLSRLVLLRLQNVLEVFPAWTISPTAVRRKAGRRGKISGIIRYRMPLKTIKEKFITYGLESEWIAAGQEVKDLLINHLLTEDMKYADFHQKSLADAGKV